MKISKATLPTVDSTTYWQQLADKHGVWLPDPSRIKDVPLERLDAIAKTLIQKAERAALLEGMGLGFGGVATVPFDASFLSAILLRLTKRLCVLYGIESSSESQRAEMWRVATAAAGVDYTKQLTEKHVLKKFAPRLAQRFVSRMGAEVSGKWASRLVPVANSAIGGVMNFSLVRTWGRRAQRSLRERYIMLQSDSVPS